MIQSSTNGAREANTEDMSFFVIRSGRRERLTYSQLFEVGHRFWLKHDYQMARSVFEELSTANKQSPRARIFLAHCFAMLGDYAACTSTLHRALPRDTYGDLASDLHDAFVFWKVGLFVDVKRILKELVRQHEDLPSLCLVLADLLQLSGATKLSATFLRRAIRTDHPDGAVSHVAQSLLDAINNN